MSPPSPSLLSPRSQWLWFILWCSILFLVALVAGIAQIAHVHPWSDVSADRIATYHKEQCEAVGTSSFFLQFANFWSNFAYLAVGFLILFRNDCWPGRSIGFILVFVALTSGIFHGTLSEFGQTIDIMGVYTVLLALLSYAFIEMIPLEYDNPVGWLIMLGSAVLGVVGAFLRTSVHFFDSDYFTVFLVFILIVYMFAVATRYRTSAAALIGPTLGAIFFGILAVLFKFTDGDSNLFANHGGIYSQCLYDPQSILQGHALWHVLSALMFLCVFEFFRSRLGRSSSVWPWVA